MALKTLGLFWPLIDNYWNWGIPILIKFIYLLHISNDASFSKFIMCSDLRLYVFSCTTKSNSIIFDKCKNSEVWEVTNKKQQKTAWNQGKMPKISWKWKKKLKFWHQKIFKNEELSWLEKLSHPCKMQYIIHAKGITVWHLKPTCDPKPSLSFRHTILILCLTHKLSSISRHDFSQL